MLFCSNCGKKTNNGVFCEHCGFRIESTETKASSPDKITLHESLWSEILIYFYIVLTLDIIGLSVILIEYMKYDSISYLTRNADLTMNVVAIVLVIIQTIIYFLLLSPKVNLLKRNNQILYSIVPTAHYLIVLSIMSIMSNNTVFSTTIGYIVFWGLVIGSLSLAIRVTSIYKIVDESTLTQKEIQQRMKEKDKLAKENSLNAIEYNYLRYF